MPAPFVFFRAHLMVYAITMEGVPLCLTVWALKHLLVHVFGEGAITRILLAVVVFGCLDRQVFSSVNLPEIRRSTSIKEFWRILLEYWWTTFDQPRSPFPEINYAFATISIGTPIFLIWKFLGFWGGVISSVLILDIAQYQLFGSECQVSQQISFNFISLITSGTSSCHSASRCSECHRTWDSTFQLRAKIRPFPPVPLDIQHEIVDACINAANEHIPLPNVNLLANLVRTCKTYQRWVEPELYRVLQVRSACHLQRLHQSLIARRNRPSYSLRQYDTLYLPLPKPLDPTLLSHQLDAGVSSPRIQALSFSSPSRSLSSKADTNTRYNVAAITRWLQHLERLSVNISLISGPDRTWTLRFYASDITILLDSNPFHLKFPSQTRGHHFHILSPSRKPRLRFAFPPRYHSSPSSLALFPFPFSSAPTVTPAPAPPFSDVKEPEYLFDPYLLPQETTHIALELALYTYPPASDPYWTNLTAYLLQHATTTEDRNSLSVRRGSTVSTTSISRSIVGRIIVVCWVLDSELPTFDLPRPPPELADSSNVLFVPLPSSRYADWTFDGLERRRVDFWEEVERIGMEWRSG